jgi:hypothetical protein
MLASTLFRHCEHLTRSPVSRLWLELKKDRIRRSIFMPMRITAAVTGPPPNNYDYKTRVIGGSRSPLCSVDRAS